MKSSWSAASISLVSSKLTLVLLLAPVQHRFKVSPLLLLFFFSEYLFFMAALDLGTSDAHFPLRDPPLLHGEATHFRFYSRVSFTVCVGVCPDCGVIKAKGKWTTQIII